MKGTVSIRESLLFFYASCVKFLWIATSDEKPLRDIRLHIVIIKISFLSSQFTLGEMKNISFIHYYREFGGNMGTKRSEILQGSQFFWFGALFFSQNWVNFKNAQNWPKYSHFSVVFRSLFNFGWKTAHQTQKIEFPEEFRFFGYPYCPQTRDNSGEIMSFMFCFEILWWKRPLVFFSLFFKMKPDVI